MTHEVVNTLYAYTSTRYALITPLQMKLARTALGLGTRELATCANVAPSTIMRFETGRGDMKVQTMDRVQRALEDGGVIFIPADAAGGPGVRLKA